MSESRFPVLILGGYGVFGGRVARELARMSRFHITVAGRSASRAAAFAATLRDRFENAEVDGIAVDVAEGIAPALRATGARLVIHSAGPFQGRDYTVARECIAAGVDYIDLSDGREFVAGFGALDDEARRAGVLAVTGASTVPGLSSAAVDRLARGLVTVRDIEIGITPGNRTDRGRAVVAAIVGGVGQPMPIWVGGAFGQVRSWQGLCRFRLSLPDGRALPARWFSAWDVPDNVLFPERYGVAGSVLFRAGLELAPLHLGVWAMSWLVRLRIVRGWSTTAPLAHRIADLLKPFGTDRGGMYVEVSGEGAGRQPVRRRWTLIAGSGHGPEIPALPAVILARKRADGRLNRAGALACLGLFDLAEFESATRHLDISCAVVERGVSETA